MAEMTFAEAVRKIRADHGLSQAALASGLGVTQPLADAWEHGRKSRWGPSRLLLRAMWEAEPTFARIAQEIWRLTT